MPKLLVIDDEESVRFPLVDLLRIEGFEVIEAADGHAGMKAALEEAPDLILCDIMMLGMDGFQLLEALREYPSMFMIPFIFLSARIEETDTEKGLNLGADDYVYKPYDPRRLIERISARLDKFSHMKDSLNQVRANLIGKVPHEFKTPLNGILGFASMMKENAHLLNPAEVRDFSALILESGERMLQTVVNYVRYLELQTDRAQEAVPAKYLNGEHPINSAELDVVLERLFAQCPERKNDIDRFVVPANLAVEGDDLAYMLYQLVENAFKFSAVGSRVNLNTVVDGDTYVLSIADKGTGMSSEEIAQLGPFIQLNRERNEQQGLGLGLSVVGDLCELYRGSLTISSQPGDGTRVILRLPLSDD